MKKRQVHTILFTEACPLNCSYCHLKDSESFGTTPTMTKEKVMALVDAIDKLTDPEEIESTLLLTGGEPLLYWDWAEEIIQKYGDRFSYRFNTSGFLFTPERLRFLSHYKCDFVLSVDGDEALTNYLRPMNNTKYHTGYMRELRKILPYLLYYFPATPFRMIVGPRYADKVHDMYLYAEQLGFRYFSLILDFECRPGHNEKGKVWTPQHTAILCEQMKMIAQEQIEGMKLGIYRPEVMEINEMLALYARGEKFSTDNYPCRLFDGRSITTMYRGDDERGGHCMEKMNPDREVIRQMIEEEYRQLNGQCPKDSECPAVDFCFQHCCPKNAYDATGSFFNIDELECELNKCLFTATMLLLSRGNEELQGNPIYRHLIKKSGFGGENNGS